jgi:DNA ligase-1
MQLPTLYKKTTTGKIQQWTVEAKKDSVITIYGQTDGKLQTTTEKVKGKNSGKKNETSDIEQAKVKAQQLWDKKIKGRYVEALEDAEKGVSSVKCFAPMLAFKIEDKPKYVQFPAIVQPKFDGLRCLAVIKGNNVQLYSRTGKPYNSLPHLVEEIKRLFCPVDNLCLDGELYNHVYKDNFNEIKSIIKRDDVHEDFEIIQYHVYDSPQDKPYAERMAPIVRKMEEEGNYLKPVKNFYAKSHEDITARFHKCLAGGYEGVMYRNPRKSYENKRSVGLMKVKVMEDAEFMVTGVVEGKGRLAGTAGAIWVKDEDGREFKAKLKSYEDSSGKRVESKAEFQKRCADWLNNFEKYKGKMLTVRFQGKTPIKKDGSGGVPRFPVGLRIRDEE